MKSLFQSKALPPELLTSNAHFVHLCNFELQYLSESLRKVSTLCPKSTCQLFTFNILGLKFQETQLFHSNLISAFQGKSYYRLPAHTFFEIFQETCP